MIEQGLPRRQSGNRRHGRLQMVDRLLMFDGGRLVADGPRDKVLALLQNPAPRPAPPVQASFGIRFSTGGKGGKGSCGSV